MVDIIDEKDQNNKVKLYLELCMLENRIRFMSIQDLSNGKWNSQDMFMENDIIKVIKGKNIMYYCWITATDVISYARSILDKSNSEPFPSFDFNANNVDFFNKPLQKDGSEDYYVVLALINVKDAEPIENYNKTAEIPTSNIILSALKGPITDLLEERRKILNNPKSQVTKNNSINVIQKNDDDDKAEETKPTSGQRDGHWFFVSKPECVQFLKLVTFQLVAPTLVHYNYLETQNNLFTAEALGKVKSIALDKTETKIFHLFQNRHCIEHSQKNDLLCKTCKKFCCLQCLATHPNDHKVRLLEKILIKRAERSKALEERIKQLIIIISTEMDMQKVELDKILTTNKDMVKSINEAKINSIEQIRQEELSRMQKLTTYVTELQRIQNDLQQKESYLLSLSISGDMTSFCTCYFLYKDYIKKNIVKNMKIISNQLKDYLKIVEPAWELYDRKNKSDRTFDAAIPNHRKIMGELLYKNFQINTFQILDCYTKVHANQDDKTKNSLTRINYRFIVRCKTKGLGASGGSTSVLNTKLHESTNSVSSNTDLSSLTHNKIFNTTCGFTLFNCYTNIPIDLPYNKTDSNYTIKVEEVMMEDNELKDKFEKAAIDFFPNLDDSCEIILKKYKFKQKIQSELYYLCMKIKKEDKEKKEISEEYLCEFKGARFIKKECEELFDFSKDDKSFNI